MYLKTKSMKMQNHGQHMIFLKASNRCLIHLGLSFSLWFYVSSISSFNEKLTTLSFIRQFKFKIHFPLLSHQRVHFSTIFLESTGYWYFSISEVTQSCPTLGNSMDCSPPGSSVHGILQARILEWVAISFSRGSSWPRDQTQVSFIAGRRFNLWATREALSECCYCFAFIFNWRGQ